MMRLLHTVALFVITAASATAGCGAAAAEKSTDIDKLVAQYADYGLFTGTVLVSDHDRVIFKKGYGLANREWNIPNAPDVKFRLGSITKQFTAMLVLQQVAAGAVKLDGHVSDYLPYYRKDTGSQVTIHQLLNHTSGIPSYTDDPKFFADVSRDPYPVVDFVKTFCSRDLEFEPGSKFHYDNSGYFILGAILEQVTGKAYEELLKSRILDPVGMQDTGYDRHGNLLPKRAAGYERGVGTMRNAPYLDMGLPYAAGSLYSTVEDLFKWDQALYTDTLLPAELKQKMFTPGLEHYGYGWNIETVPPNDPGAGQSIVSHGGGINGFNTLEQRLVKDHVLVVLLNNSPGVNLDAIARGIRAILYGQEPQMPKRPLVTTLGDTIAKSGVDAAVAQYRELKRTDAAGYDFAEARLNNLGNLLLNEKRTPDAIAILKLNVEEYPKSANVYAALGDAYERGSQKQLAIENYRRAIQINPGNERAKSRLKELEGRP